FCIALDDDLSFHVVAVLVDVKGVGRAGLDPANAPVVWEVSYDNPNWLPCEVEFDSTHGFHESGPQIVVLRLPEMKKREQEGLPGVSAFWLQKAETPGRPSCSR